MSTETMLITAALSLLTFLLPSAAGHSLRDYCNARGKTRALLLLPGLWLGYLIACGTAFSALLFLRIGLPAMQQTLSWIGMAFFFIYVLRTQAQRLRLRIADNDNLAQNGTVRAVIHMAQRAIRPALIIALCAVLLQVVDSRSSGGELVRNLLPSMGFAAFIAPILQVIFSSRSVLKAKAFRKQIQASRKPPTRFIASRAVTAGYRRIAA